MVAAITSFMSEVSALWVQTVPPTNPHIRYRRASGRSAETGAAGDRVFYFSPPVREEPQAECGREATHVMWQVLVNIRLSDSGRSREDMAEAVANEGNLLARKVETKNSWTASGILEVITEEITPEFDPDSGDYILAFSLRVLCSETDG